MKASNKQRRKDPGVRAADLGPLQWLVQYANIGVDGNQALGPLERLMDSRFLGQDGTHKGYVLDPKPKRPARIIEHSDPRGKEIIQERRGVIMRWWQGPDDQEPTPQPHDSPLELRGTVTWEWLMEQFPPPRPVMPRLASRYGQRPATDPASGEHPDWLEPAVMCVVEIQRLVRFFLETLWRARRGAGPAPGRMSAKGIARFVAIQEEIIVPAYMEGISRACADPRPTPPKPLEPPESADEFMRALWGMQGEIFDTIWRNRAPIWARPSDHSGSPPIFVSDNPGGIAWAEVLNAASVPATWSSLCVCRCGRFWISATPTGRGRPKESCGLCRVPFSEYGFADRRHRRNR